MNKVILIGNLTRDPELTETPSGVKVCCFSLAVTRNYTGSDGERKTDFFNCVAWRGLGETVAKYSRKGNKLSVSGSIELRNYEDNEGIKRTAVDIVAQDVEFLTPRQSDSNDSVSERRSGGRPALQEFDDDGDIPF